MKTCAALIHNNRRCERHKECVRAVSWFEDRTADFNLCGQGQHFAHFLPRNVPAALRQQTPVGQTMELFA